MRLWGPRSAPASVVLAGLLVAAGIGAAPAAGDTARSEPVSARLTVDNDHFNFWQSPGWRPDFGYTHGTEIALRLPHAPRSLARLVPARLLGRDEAGGDVALELRLTQHIYSPWRYPPDRSYAGWLGAAIGLSRRTGLEHRELLLILGVTGPPSLAGAVQRSMHTRFADGEPPDWSGQLPFEPGFGLEAGIVRSLATSGTGGGGPGIALGLAARGRLATHAVDLRVGLPWVAGWPAPGLGPEAAGARRGPSLHVRLEPHVDLIARDEFLDGTLFRSRPGPGARPVVAESEAALGVGWGPALLEWTVFRRSREFDLQPKPHTYSSLALHWNP